MTAKIAVCLLAVVGLLAGPLSVVPAAPVESAPAEIRDAVDAAVGAVNPALVRIELVTVDYTSGREQKSQATGSGVILTKEGHVVTNHHVAGNAKQIICTLANKDEIDADLVGTDPLTDICVIKLRPEKPREFAAAKFGDSSLLRVGDRVLAMGSPLALSQSVTMGIVSNTELVIPRLYYPFRFEIEGEDVGSIVRWIGHDAAISPGNSGGPLVNLAGEVVGINEMRFGLAGAIPSNLAREVAEQIIREGKVTRAWLGVNVQAMLKVEQEREGVLVGGTIPGSPAEKAGFQAGDVIVSVAGKPVSARVGEELPVFNQMAGALPIGEDVEVEVERGGKRVKLRVRPEERERARPRDRELSEWGMTARDLSRLGAKELGRESRDGALVTSIRPGGPCEDAKPRIMERDVVVEVAGEPVRSVEELGAATDRITAGKGEAQATLVGFERRGERYLTVVKLGREPAPQPTREVRKAWLGVATQVLTREMAEAMGLEGETGVRVTQVYPNTTAEKAGLKTGDILIALDGDEIAASQPQHVDVFPTMIRQRAIGAEAELTVVRGKERQTVKVTLERSPELARGMARYRDDNFDFVARDIAFEDRVQNRWREDQVGAVVDSVKEGGWAAVGQLGVGDLILEVNGEQVREVAGFEQAMKKVAKERPESVVLRVRRNIHGLYVELRPKWPAAEGG